MLGPNLLERRSRMKEVIAVIRSEMWQETVDAAQAIGLTEYSHLRVMGRGKQRGLRYMPRSTEATTA